LGREPPPSNLRPPPPGRGDGPTGAPSWNSRTTRNSSARASHTAPQWAPSAAQRASKADKAKAAVRWMTCPMGGGEWTAEIQGRHRTRKNITFSFALFFSVCLTFKISVSAKKRLYNGNFAPQVRRSPKQLSQWLVCDINCLYVYHIWFATRSNAGNDASMSQKPVYDVLCVLQEKGWNASFIIISSLILDY